MKEFDLSTIDPRHFRLNCGGSVTISPRKPRAPKSAPKPALAAFTKPAPAKPTPPSAPATSTLGAARASTEGDVVREALAIAERMKREEFVARKVGERIGLAEQLKRAQLGAGCADWRRGMS